MAAKESPVRCPRCGQSYRSRNAPWVCAQCQPDETADAIASITAGLARTISARSICRYDGCLLIGAGTCPACQLRLMRHHARSRRATTPPGWVRKGVIYMKERQESA